MDLRSPWDGVRDTESCNFLRSMKLGDQVGGGRGEGGGGAGYRDIHMTCRYRAI